MSSNHIDRFFRALIKHFPGIIMSVFSLLSILAVSVLLILMMRNWSPHIHPANAHLVILGGLMALSGIALWRKWTRSCGPLP